MATAYDKLQQHQCVCVCSADGTHGTRREAADVAAAAMAVAAESFSAIVRFIGFLTLPIFIALLPIVRQLSSQQSATCE